MVEQSDKLNIFGKSDEEKAIAQAYQAAVIKYPMGKGDCKTVKDALGGLQSEIDAQKEKKLGSGKGTVENRIMAGLTRRQIEFQAQLDKLDCIEADYEAEKSAAFDQQLDLMQQSKSLTSATTSTTKYIVFGMLGVVVLVAGFVIIKKLKK